MNKNQNIEELVGKYLEGEMTDLEKINFENQLANNSNIQEEFQFQNDVIEGIRENRKAELKARLDQIPVSSSSIYQYIGLKVAALITITTMIGFGAYYTFFNERGELAKENIVTLNEATDFEVTPNLPEMPAPVIEEEIKSEEIVIDKRKVEDKSGKKVKKESENDELTADTKTASDNIPSPDIVKPESVEVIADAKIEQKDDSFEISNNSLNNIKDVMENKVEVETISDNKKNFHYQFYNKKLYLYGDFDKTPYEILEYNASGVKLFYLYYEGKYYELNSNQMKTTVLREIENEELVSELNQLRK